MSSTTNHVIAHHFGTRVSGLLKDRWPEYAVHEVDAAHAWSLPVDTSVLLSGPSKVWADGPREQPIDWPKRLTWVQIPGAGADQYPGWLLRNHVVTTGRGLNSGPIAEFALASMLSYAKRFPHTWISRQQDWRILQMDTLEGRTLGLLGFGSVAREVVRRALAFNMHILVHRRSAIEPPPDGVRYARSLAAMLADADHLVLAAPYTPETHHIINREALSGMKPGAHIVNVARGGLIDHDALLQALDSGRIGSASIDVTEPEPLPAGHPLYTHPRVRLSPHIAWNSPDTIDRLVVKFNQNLERLIEGRTLLDVLDVTSVATA
jgi:phosphoglycerate dehydrogenase-like enzyme